MCSVTFVKLFYFAFTGLHTITTIKAGKNYSSIAEGFKDVLDEIKIIHQSVGGKTIKFMKYCWSLYMHKQKLLLLLGLTKANSNYACLWFNIYHLDR